MSPRGYTEMPGLRLKFRHSDDREWLTATVWIDGEPVREISRLSSNLAGPPGGEVYQGWVLAVEAAFNALLKNATGDEAARAFRRRPDYTGEQK